MIKRIVLSFSLLVLFVTLVVPATARAQESFYVGYDGYAGFQGPIWAARDLGLFKKYGVNGDLVLVPGSPRAMAALLSGNVHVAQGSATAPIAGRLRGADIVIVAAALNKLPFSVVVQKEIRKPSDLIGKKIGILSYGGSTDLAVALALKEWNIPRQAVTILAAGGAPERLASLSSKVIDATVVSPPETVAAGHLGMTNLANLSELKASFPMTVITVRRAYLEKNRDSVKRFVRAYSEAIYQFKNNKEKALAVYAGRLKQQNPAVLEATYQYYAPMFSFPPRPIREGIRNAFEMVSERNPDIKGDLNFEQFVDQSIIDELEKEGFFSGLKIDKGR